MASVFDVAAYILHKQGPVTVMKLQKLVYYSQAWSLVWDEKLLFRNKIEAWANGPVVPALYRVHRGQFEVSRLPQGDKKALTKQQRETVDAVLDCYGEKPSRWLSELAHTERPWVEARRGLKPGERGRNEITHAAMAEYYEAL